MSRLYYSLSASFPITRLPVCKLQLSHINNLTFGYRPLHGKRESVAECTTQDYCVECASEFVCMWWQNTLLHSSFLLLPILCVINFSTVRLSIMMKTSTLFLDISKHSTIIVIFKIIHEYKIFMLLILKNYR